MGITHVKACLKNLSGFGPPCHATFIVDTGAIHCIAPRSELVKALISVEGKRQYEMANGMEFEYDFGFARIELMGLQTVCHVVFGPDDVDPVIGVVVLENLGLLVDPVSQSLIVGPISPLK